MTNSFFLVKWLFLAMDWVYQQLTQYLRGGGWVVVLTIFLFTLAIKLLTIFSDIKSRKSGIQMQQIQPDLDKLKKKYANDPQKLNMEQRKLMKERGVSSLGGCLPMLIMLPLLFMFFAAFRNWSSQQMLDMMLKINAGQGAEAFANARFLWITNIWRPDSLESPSFGLMHILGGCSCAGGASSSGGVLMTGTDFWNTFASLNKDGEPAIMNYIFYTKNTDALNELLYKLHFFTKTIAADGTVQYVRAMDSTAFIEAYKAFVTPITGNEKLIGGAYESMSNGFAILPLVAGATTFLSSWIMQKNQPKPAAAASDSKDDPTAQAQNMSKYMIYLMPLMSVFFCYMYDSTFAFYWIFSNVISLAITLIVNATLVKKWKSDTVEVVKK